jgi:WD40 repeat protein
MKSFMQQDPLITICQSGVIGVNGWQSYDRSQTNLFFSFEKDPSLLSDKSKKSVAGPFDSQFEIDQRNFVLTHDSKLLITGGHWDNSLRVFSLTKYRNIAHIYQNSNVITCLAIDYQGQYVVSGSMDTTCMIWQVVQEYGVSINLDPIPMHILYGHKKAVACVDVSNELDMVVSAGLDGQVNIHSLRSGCFVRSLSFVNEKIASFRNLNVKLSNLRHILVYVEGKLNANLNQAKKFSHEIFLFSINGKMVCMQELGYPVQDMIIKDDYCVLAILITNTKSSLNTSLNSTYRSETDSPNTSFASNRSNATFTGSKIIFKEIFE